jgi:streptogramin lyase
MNYPGKCKLFFVMLAIIANSFFLHAQTTPLKDLFIRHIGEKEGLLHNAVNCFYQDNRGYMWVGGRALQRYDGIRFKTYFDGSELISFNAIVEDSGRNIWMGSTKGMFQYDRFADKLSFFQDSIQFKGKKLLFSTHQAYCDKRGNVWVAGPGFYGIKPWNKTQFVGADQILSIGDGNNTGYFFHLDDRDRIWYSLGKEYGIAYYDTQLEKVFSHYSNPNQQAVLDQKVSGNFHYCVDRNDRLWINDGFERRVLGRWDSALVKFVDYQIEYPRQLEVMGNSYFAVPGKMMLGSKKDLYIDLSEHMGFAKYNEQTDNFECVYSDYNFSNGLWDHVTPAFPSYGSYIDRQGLIWYAGEGISLLAPTKQLFRATTTGKNDVLMNDRQPKNGFLGTPLTSIIKMNDGYYYGGFYGDGFWQIDSNFNLLKKIVLPKSAHNLVWTLFSGDGKTVFLGEQWKNLFGYDITQQKFRQLPNTFSQVTKTYVEHKESVWLMHWNSSITHFNPVTFEMHNYPIWHSPDSQKIRNVVGFMPDGKGGLWITASNTGLHLFDIATKKITYSWFPNPNKKDDLTTNALNAIVRVNEDTLLLGGNGLFIYNHTTKKAEYFGAEQGLPCYAVTSILRDQLQKNLFWLNTSDKGICLFNLTTKSITTFPSDVGNNNLVGDYTRLFDSVKNNILFSHSKGYSVINRNNYNYVVADNQQPVIITEIWVNGQSLSVDSIMRKGSLRLKSDQNRLAIKLATLNFWSSSKIQYFYKLSKNEDWQLMEKDAELSFVELSPGEYDLSFVAAENRKAIGQTATTLSVSVLPPFYKSWWFLTIGILGIVVLAIWYNHRELKTVRNEARLQQKIVETEMQSLRAQMSPHFVFNSLNSIENFIMQNEKRLASDYLNKFSQLIRSILESSTNELVPVRKDLQSLSNYVQLEQLRFNHRFSYQVEIDPQLVDGDFFVPSLLVQPYLENAILHGLVHSEKENLLLKLKIALAGDQIRYTIIDNGIGRAKAAAYNLQNKPNHKSVGLKITQDRINLFNKTKQEPVLIEDLTDESGNALGTKVDIILNIG